MSVIGETVPLSGRPGRRLTPIVWLFVAIVLSVLALSHLSIALLASGRAYVGGEGLWSKGQKDAVYFLSRYGASRNEADYQLYLKSIAVPLGDRKARLELEKPAPNLEIARAGFEEGRNHRDDIDGMIDLFRHFRRVEFMSHAIDIWTRADANIERLVEIGEDLHRAVTLGNADRMRIVALLTEIDVVNARLTPLEDEFSLVLGRAHRFIQMLLQAFMIMAAGLMLLVGIYCSRRMLRQSELVQNALEESELQLRKVLLAAPVPIIMSRIRDNTIVFANERAVEQLKAPAASLVGGQASRYYAKADDRGTLLRTLQEKGVFREQEVLLKDQHNVPFWVLMSSQMLTYMNEACILTAFNNFDARKHMQEEMEHRAYHDDLTNLPNRPMFVESLRQAIARAERNISTLTVLFIDLDRFKEVNDTRGHQAGDQLLREVAKRLVESVRKSDLVARIGGDEFVVLIEEQHDNMEVAAIARKILLAMERSFSVHQSPIDITASMGISHYPADGTDLNDLIRNADSAMYQAKQKGRNNFQFFASRHTLDDEHSAAAQ